MAVKIRWQFVNAKWDGFIRKIRRSAGGRFEVCPDYSPSHTKPRRKVVGYSLRDTKTGIYYRYRKFSECEEMIREIWNSEKEKGREKHHTEMALRFLQAGAQCARDAATEIKYVPVEWNDELANELGKISDRLEEIHTNVLEGP